MTYFVIGSHHRFQQWRRLKALGEDDVAIHITGPLQLQGFCVPRAEGEVVDLADGDPNQLTLVALAHSVICR